MQKDQPLCPFCTAPDAILHTSSKGIDGKVHNYYQCDDCGSVFLWPFPEKEELIQSYDESYYGAKQKKFTFPGVEDILDIFRAGRASRIASLTEGSGKILDIGCGNGRFLHLLGKKGDYTLLGSELPGQAAIRAGRYPEIRLSTSGEFHEEAGTSSLNAVTMFHVLEHLRQPTEIIEEICNALKPGGYFYVSFPNIYSHQAKKFGADWLHLDPPHHLVFPKAESFERKLKEMGFSRVYRSTQSAEQNPFGWVQSFLNRKSKKRDLLYEFMKGNKTYASESPFWALALQLLFMSFSLPALMLVETLGRDRGKGASLNYIFQKR